jgi:hypothetical protein
LADDQEWSFPDPPLPGVDAEYEALLEARREAEDSAEVLRIELAISFYLLSRNYDLTPADYLRIFDFEGDRTRLRSVQTAVSAMLSVRPKQGPGSSGPDQAASRGESARTGRLSTWLCSWAVRVKSVLGF